MSTIMKTKTSFSDTGDRGVPLAITPVRDAGTALERAGINFRVDSTPLSDLLPNQYGNKYHAAVRSTDGAILGVNSARFHHHQPEVLGVLGEAIVKVHPDAFFSAGGQSPDERTQFLVVTLNSDPIVGRDGGNFHNVLLANGTNGNCMFTGTAFNFRLFCLNQFRALFQTGATLFRLGHTWSASLAIPTAIKAVQDAVRTFDEMDLMIEQLLSTPLPGSPMQLIEKIVGEKPPAASDDKAGRLLTNWSQQVERMRSEYLADHNANARGTAWGLVMAAEAVDEHGSRGAADKRDAQRMNRVLTGDYPRMRRALELVTG